MPEAPFSRGGLGLADLAAALGLPAPAAGRLRDAGLLPGVGIGSDWYCSPEHLSAWMAASVPDGEQCRLRELLAGAGEEA